MRYEKKQHQYDNQNMTRRASYGFLGRSVYDANLKSGKRPKIHTVVRIRDTLAVRRYWIIEKVTCKTEKVLTTVECEDAIWQSPRNT